MSTEPMQFTRTYAVTGMTCEHCVRAVTEELTELAGVTEVSVDLSPGEASTVTVTSSTELATGHVAEALDEAGDYALTR